MFLDIFYFYIDKWEYDKDEGEIAYVLSRLSFIFYFGNNNIVGVLILIFLNMKINLEGVC